MWPDLVGFSRINASSGDDAGGPIGNDLAAPSVFEQEHGAGGKGLGIGSGGQSAGPSKVAMDGWVELVSALGKFPGLAGIDFPERKIILSDIRLALGKDLFGDT